MGNSQGSYEVTPSKGLKDDDSSESEDRALGIETCAIPASRITASSSTDSAPAFFARLNGTKSWCAGSPADCFLEVDLDTVHYVTAVATQGNPSGNKDYVKMYKIQYSTDGLEWEFYKENYKQVLEGNTDNFSVVKRKLDPKIMTRYVRFWPTAWFQWPCLRVEIYGKKAPPEKMSQNGCTTINLEAQERPPPEENEPKQEIEGEQIRDNVDVEIEINTLDGDKEAILEVEERVDDVQTEGYEKIFESLDTSTPAKPNGVVNKHSGVKQTENGQVLASRGDDVGLKRLMEVKTKLEFEAEARKLHDEQNVEMRRKKNKKVTLDYYETPDYFYVPRRVYNDMWGDSPIGSLSEGLDNEDKEKKPLIEQIDGGAPLAKLDDDMIDEGVEQTRTVTIQTVRTVTTRVERRDHDHGNHCAHAHDLQPDDKGYTKYVENLFQTMNFGLGAEYARALVSLRIPRRTQGEPILSLSLTEMTQSEPDFFMFNGFDNEPVPFAARASCEHLHPTDPAVQVAMESSFSERVDSMDQIDINPLTNRRFSGLDLLQSPYDAVSGDDIERLLAWEDETLPGWTKVKKTRDYEILKGTAVDGGPPIIKTVITLKKIAYDEAVRRITNWEIRKEWDKTFDKVTFIEQSYNFNVLHCAMKKQGLTLAVLDDVDIDEPYHASVWSVADHPDSSLLSKGKPLRYETMISGLVIRPTPDGYPSSRVTLLCQVKGSVSPPLKNSFLVGNPDKWLDMLKKYSPKRKDK